MSPSVAQVYRVREFLTGQLLATFLDLLTLAVLLPFLFWLNAPLAWVVLLCAGMISVIILAYLKPMREMYSRVVGAETWKAATLGETIVGIKTVKALALEPQVLVDFRKRRGAQSIVDHRATDRFDYAFQTLTDNAR
jgi:subfamily B ATP-binding cassette protein HlyB/CyaB